MITQKEANRAIKVWPSISRLVSTIHSEAQYMRTLSFLDNLIDDVSQKKDAAKESLIDTIGTLIKDYEDRNMPEPKGDAVGCLKYLMDEHKLKQKDLKEIGSQGVVSEILSGKRELNAKQIKLLSKRFSVSPSLFIDVN
jgi:HTH-type transcriptional regulator/antitoxin HigA